MGALSKLDKFLLNPQVRTCFLTVPGTSRNSHPENQEPIEDRSSDARRPEVRLSSHPSGNLKSPEVEEYHHMVTGGQGGSRNRPHMMTGIKEEIPYCSPGASSRKEKKARSTSQPQFRSENNPAIIEADHIFLAHQQLATNTNSANFKNNINRISKLLKFPTTKTPTFDGKPENFKLFEDLFQTSFKNHNQLKEEDKINYLQPLMRSDALQTFKNITSPNREENLVAVLTVLRRK